jgi:hypothetical protein
MARNRDSIAAHQSASRSPCSCLQESDTNLLGFWMGDLLENAVAEAILDMKLGLAIEEGDTGEYVDEDQIISKLTD